MQTIGSRRPSRSPRGDVQAGCAYCDTQWLRSDLRRDRAGNLACRDCRDYEGRDAVTLSEENAAGTRSGSRVSHLHPENYHNTVGSGSVLHRTTADQITQ